MTRSSIDMDRFTLDDLFLPRPSLTGAEGLSRGPLVMEQPSLAQYLLGEVACGRSELVAGRTSAEVPVPVMRHVEFLTERQEGVERFYEASAEIGLAVSMLRVGNVLMGQSRTLGRNQGRCILEGATLGHEVVAATYESAQYAQTVFDSTRNVAIYIGQTLGEQLAVA